MFRCLLVISVVVYAVSAASDARHQRQVDEILQDMNIMKRSVLARNIVTKRQYTSDMCAQIPESHIFQCTEGETACIPKSRQCDGVIDCNDGSDEVDCVAEHVADCQSSFVEKGIEYIQCASDNMCLDKCRKCDGVCDCLDESDEADCGGYENPLICQIAADVDMCAQD